MIEKNVNFISAEQALDLRTRVLRPGQPLSTCQYAEDHDATTFHLGVLLNERIISNGTFMQQSNPNFSLSKKAYRLRGMATDPDFQKQGWGKIILNFAVDELKKRECDLLWFNARLSAEAFYSSLGFEGLETVFNIPGAGDHRIMFKWL